MEDDHRQIMIIIYLFLISAVIWLKPQIAFDKEDNLRPFGVTKQGSTILPFWLIIFVISVLSYIGMMYLKGFRR
jgi:quinol-cytochrome oxidoreductase complex cytochrome b subunit